MDTVRAYLTIGRANVMHRPQDQDCPPPSAILCLVFAYSNQHVHVGMMVSFL